MSAWKWRHVSNGSEAPVANAGAFTTSPRSVLSTPRSLLSTPRSLLSASSSLFSARRAAECAELYHKFSGSVHREELKQLSRGALRRRLLELDSAPTEGDGMLHSALVDTVLLWNALARLHDGVDPGDQEEALVALRDGGLPTELLHKALMVVGVPWQERRLLKQKAAAALIYDRLSRYLKATAANLESEEAHHALSGDSDGCSEGLGSAERYRQREVSIPPLDGPPQIEAAVWVHASGTPSPCSQRESLVDDASEACSNCSRDEEATKYAARAPQPVNWTCSSEVGLLSQAMKRSAGAPHSIDWSCCSEVGSFSEADLPSEPSCLGRNPSEDTGAVWRTDCDDEDQASRCSHREHSRASTEETRNDAQSEHGSTFGDADVALESTMPTLSGSPGKACMEEIAETPPVSVL